MRIVVGCPGCAKLVCEVVNGFIACAPACEVIIGNCLACAGVDYKTSTKVTAIDAKSKTLTSESGDTISYEKLIYATGARVCSPNPALTDQPMSQKEFEGSKKGGVTIICVQFSGKHWKGKETR